MTSHLVVYCFTYIFFLVKLKYLCILTISMITTITNSFHKIFIDSTHQCQWYLCSFISYRFIYIVASDRISCLKPYVIYCVHISLLHYLLIHWSHLLILHLLFQRCCHKHGFYILTSFPLDITILRLVEYTVILFLFFENHLPHKCSRIPFTL